MSLKYRKQPKGVLVFPKINKLLAVMWFWFGSTQQGAQAEPSPTLLTTHGFAIVCVVRRSRFGRLSFDVRAGEGMCVDKIIYLYIGSIALILLGIGLPGVLLSGGYDFFPTEGFNQKFFIAILISSTLITLYFIFQRIIGVEQYKWWPIIASFPINLFLGLLLWASVKLLIQGWIFTYSDNIVSRKLEVYSSSSTCDRGQPYRNEYFVEGVDGYSFWCSKDRFNGKRYIGTFKEAMFGRVLIGVSPE